MSVSPPSASHRFFDANVMLGPIPTGQATSRAADLAQMLRRFHVHEALVSHTYGWRHDVATGNAVLADEVTTVSGLRQCWVDIPPLGGDKADISSRLDGAAEAGVDAFRLYPRDHGYDVLGADAAQMLESLRSYGAPVLVDADQVTWAAVEQLAHRYPGLPLVVLCTGYRDLRAMSGALERHEHVYVDLSYLGSHTGLEWLVSRFGSSRLLFGTGYPTRDPADAVTRLLWSELDDRDVEAIGGGNLRELLDGRRRW